MTSVNRVGDRTSGHAEETIRIGLTEAEAETLGMILDLVGGPTQGSRRVHAYEIKDGLAMIGVLTSTTERDTATGEIRFLTDDNYNFPLDAASQEVTYL